MDTNDNTSQQRATTTVMIVSAFMATFMSSSLNLAVPGMGSYFDVSAASVSWVVTAFILATAALSVPFGKLADTTGRRRIFLIGILLFFSTSFISALAKTFAVMILLRLIQGIAAAMLNATNTAILISAYPPSEKGKAIGRMTAGTYVGLSSGPVVGGILNQWLGWQSIFIFSGAVGLFAFVLAVRKLPKKEHLMQELSHDGMGNILYIAMIVMVMYGFTTIGGGISGPVILCGLAAGIGFVFTELKSKTPVIDVRIFAGNPAYTLSNLAALLNYGATFAVGYFMSIYLQTAMGYSSQTAGLILIAQPLMMALFSPKMGRLSDKIAPYKLATAGMLICTASLVFFATVNESTPLAAIIAALLATGFGISVFSSPNMNAIMSCVEKSDYGIASSILATMRTLGQTSGMAVITLVIGIYMGDAALADAAPGQLTHTMRTGFTIFAIICFIGAMMSLKRRNAPKHKASRRSK